MTGGRLPEAIVVAAAGASLGAAAGSPFGVGMPLAVIAGANGAVSGWRATYRWNSPDGLMAFVLDSTWAIATTSAGLVSHAVGAARGRPEYAPELSRRHNRHVYGRGFQPRRGFAVTLGNVISGAGDVARPRRAKLVTDHEDVHVWQSRWLGPLYPVIYAGWATGGALAGVVVWAVTGREQSLRSVVESCAYYLNPFEWWAYSRDDNWPPPGLAGRIGPARPIVRSFASFR